jgi:hypothetical protein
MKCPAGEAQGHVPRERIELPAINGIRPWPCGILYISVLNCGQMENAVEANVEGC